MSLGALTTTYMPAPSCLSALNGLTMRDGGFPFFHGPVTTDGCFPDRYDWQTTKYYSPGVCPAGYTSACSRTNTAGSVTETVVTCCPSSYVCNTSPTFGWEGTYICASWFTGKTVFPTMQILASTGPSTVVRTESFTLAAGLTSAFNAFGLQIRFQSTDFTSPTSTGTTSPATEPAVPQNNSGSGGLSTASAAGVAIGCAIGGILIAVAMFFAFRSGKRAARRKAMESQAHPLQQDPPPHSNSPGEMDPSVYTNDQAGIYPGYNAYQHARSGYSEVSGDDRNEKYRDVTVELPGHGAGVAELA